MDHCRTRPLPRVTWSTCAVGAIALAALAPACVQAITTDDIPMYPGATLLQSRQLTREHVEAEYQALLPDGTDREAAGEEGRKAAAACLAIMEEAGWVLERENRQRRGGEFWLRKDAILTAKVVIAARARPIEGRMQETIGFDFDLRRLIPYEDVLGRDPLDVPRYPGSIRVRWMDLLGDYACKRLVVAPVDDVRVFFGETLPEHGWEPGKGVGDLNYTKGGLATRDDAGAAAAGGDPVTLAAEAIPTTLTVHLDDEKGIVSIGIGRSAGAAYKGKQIGGPVTPEAPEPREREEAYASLDVESDLPVYPGLELESTRIEPIDTAGCETTKLVYAMADAHPSEALAMAGFYLKQLRADGWHVEEDEWFGIGRTLVFRKGAVAVKVAIKAVGRYPIPDGARPIRIPVQVDAVLPIPSEDLAGEDIDGVPRFPGSRRFYALEAATDHIVKFKAIAEPDQVERFFVNRLAEGDWTFAGNDTTGLLFVPSTTPASAAGALAAGQLVPTTLKIKVDDMLDGSVKIGMDLTKGD